MKLDVSAMPYEDVRLDGQVRLVSLPEWTLAGLPVTCAFAGAVADRIEPAKRDFYRRVEELDGLRVRPERYACVHYATYPTLFTYIFSVEIGRREGGLRTIGSCTPCRQGHMRRFAAIAIHMPRYMSGWRREAWNRTRGRSPSRCIASRIRRGRRRRMFWFRLS